MNNTQQIIKIDQRESGGSIGGRALEYQKNWAICKLIELHKTGNDFLMSLEFHDDVIVLNSSENPTSIDFYQVKTSNKNITLYFLLKSSEGEMCILSKLYDNKVKFPNLAKNLYVISNANYNLRLPKNKSKKGKTLIEEKICCSDIHEDELTKVKNKIKNELELNECPILDNTMYLISSDLPRKGAGETYTIGELTKYFSELDFNCDTILAYYYIYGEVKRKSHKVMRKIYSMNDLISGKSISKEYFNKLLAEVQKYNKNNNKSIKDEINRFIRKELPKDKRKDYLTSARDYYAMRYNNEAINEITRNINTILNETDNLELDTWIDINYIYREYTDRKYRHFHFKEVFIKVIILIEYIKNTIII